MSDYSPTQNPSRPQAKPQTYYRASTSQSKASSEYRYRVQAQNQSSRPNTNNSTPDASNQSSAHTYRL